MDCPSNGHLHYWQSFEQWCGQFHRYFEHSCSAKYQSRWLWVQSKKWQTLEKNQVQLQFYFPVQRCWWNFHWAGMFYTVSPPLTPSSKFHGIIWALRNDSKTFRDLYIPSKKKALYKYRTGPKNVTCSMNYLCVSVFPLFAEKWNPKQRCTVLLRLFCLSF